MKALKPLGNRVISVEEARKIIDKMPQNNPMGNRDKYFRLDNIVCNDSKGEVIEAYDRINVRMYPLKNEDGSLYSATLYEALHTLDFQGWTIPSMPLLCNILLKISNQRQPGFKKYLESMQKSGVILTNTVYDGDEKQFYHYPNIWHFPDCPTNAKHGFNEDKLHTTPILDYVPEDHSITKSVFNQRSNAFFQDLTGINSLDERKRIATNPHIDLKLTCSDLKSPAFYRVLGNEEVIDLDCEFNDEGYVMAVRL